MTLYVCLPPEAGVAGDSKGGGNARVAGSTNASARAMSSWTMRASDEYGVNGPRMPQQRRIGRKKGLRENLGQFHCCMDRVGQQ
jgi:hypothetical protein